MPHRIACVLLAVTLVSSGVSAPFMHVHAHGASSHGEGIDEHCAHHHAEGVHWHPTRSAAPDSGGALATGAGHRHAAVALSGAAIESSSTDLGRSLAAIETPETGAAPVERGVRTPVDPTAGPDPPHRTAAARAPPVRS